MKRSIRRGAALAILLGAAVAAASLTVPASAAQPVTPTGHVAHAVHGQVAKPAPTPPAAPKATSPKTPSHANASAQAAAWSVSLTPSSESVLVTQYITLTATADQPVDGTGNTIVIWDDSDVTRTIIASCTTGTTCSGSARHDTAMNGMFDAEIVNGTDELADDWAYPSWQGVDINSLTADQTTVGVGGTVTLTAALSNEILPTALWLLFYDTTTGTYVGQCYSGTSCVVTVSQSAATTHTYRAYLTVGSLTTAYPPANVEWQSIETAYATWTPDAYRVSLSVTQAGSYDSPTILAATASTDVGPTPYYIEVFDETTGTLTGQCAHGATCTVTDANPPQTFDVYVAFISHYGTTLPPSGVEANSATQTVLVRPIP